MQDELPVHNPLEVWMRGPVDDIPPLLQPVAHTLLQVREELSRHIENFDDTLLWTSPAGMASVGFHLKHLTGILDRLFSYAKGISLTIEQLQYLKSESIEVSTVTSTELVIRFNKQVDVALAQLKETDESTLLEVRGIGRKQIPSTVIGLLFHAAEHASRHMGQVLVTVKIIAKS